MAADPFPLIAELQATVMRLSDRVHMLEDEVRTLRAPAATTTTAAPVPVAAATTALAPLDAHKADEKERILAALTKCNWNRVKAAKLLKLPRRTLYRRLEEYGIQ